MTDPDDIDGLLAAYADGELDDAAAREVERYLADHPAARSTLAVHRETTALLRAAFSESLFDKGRPIPPVALPLAATTPLAIPLASRRGASTGRGSTGGSSTGGSSTGGAPVRPRHGWALAASVLMGLVGYGAGVFWPDPLISKRDRMLSEIAEYHAVYSRETVHLVEVPATQADHLKLWLGKRVNRQLVIPDLKSAGLTFAGGRLVVLDGAPVAELMYTREKGLPIGFCILYHEGKAEALDVQRRGAMHIARWDDGSHSYVVVGEADPATVRELATLAQKQI